MLIKALCNQRLSLNVFCGLIATSNQLSSLAARQSPGLREKAIFTSYTTQMFQLHPEKTSLHAHNQLCRQNPSPLILAVWLRT
jgi:hypothetical protein